MDPRWTLPLLQQAHDEAVLMTGLLHSLSRMILAGHRPSNFLIFRLTDGRVKLIRTPDGRGQEREEAGRIRNEYGPVSLSFSVSVRDRCDGLSLAVENLGRRGPARVEQLWKRVEQTFEPETPCWFPEEHQHRDGPALTWALVRRPPSRNTGQAVETAVTEPANWLVRSAGRCHEAERTARGDPPAFFSETPQSWPRGWA